MPIKAFFSLHILCPDSFQGNLADSVYKIGLLLFSIFGQVHLFHQVGMDLLDHHWASLESVRAHCGHPRGQVQPLVSLWFLFARPLLQSELSSPWSSSFFLLPLFFPFLGTTSRQTSPLLLDGHRQFLVSV